MSFYLSQKLPKDVCLLLCKYIAAANYEAYSDLPWPKSPSKNDLKLYTLLKSGTADLMFFNVKEVYVEPTEKMHAFRKILMEHHPFII